MTGLARAILFEALFRADGNVLCGAAVDRATWHALDRFEALEWHFSRRFGVYPHMCYGANWPDAVVALAGIR